MKQDSSLTSSLLAHSHGYATSGYGTELDPDSVFISTDDRPFLQKKKKKQKTQQLSGSYPGFQTPKKLEKSRMSNSSLLDDPLALVQRAIEADTDETPPAYAPEEETPVEGPPPPDEKEEKQEAGASATLADVAADTEDLLAIGILPTTDEAIAGSEDDEKKTAAVSPGGTLGPRASALLSGKRRSTLRRRSVDDHLGEIDTALSMPTDLPSSSTPKPVESVDALPDYETANELKVTPPMQMVRTVSLDTGRKVEEDKRKSLKVQSALDGGILSTKQPTLEILPMARGTSASKKKRDGIHDDDDSEIEHQGSTVIVPPRSVLLRMPIYSTPLTLESTNNAYRDFVSRLMGMGFELGQAECAVIMTSAESVETAVEFIFQHPDGLWHRFKPSEGTKELMQERNKAKGNTVFEELFEKRDLCEVCGLQYWRHYLDPNGEKIKQEGGDVSDDALHGDLLGRVSMSVATREHRDDLMASIRTMDGNRLRIIQQIEEEEEMARRNSSGLIVNYLGSNSAAGFSNQQQEVADEPAYDGPMETCMVCFDEKPTTKFLMAPCGHNYCHECLKQHYRVKTRDGDVLKIECIDPKCDREITEEEVKKCLQGDRELLDKFERFRRDRLLMMDPSIRFCVTPDCDGFMTGNRFRPKMECPVCHVHVCFNCNQPWHGYFVGCNNNVDVATSLWALNKDVQKCPRCKVTIEKNEGCNHMTCQSCKFEFCWICRGPYSSDHFEPWNIFGCPGAQYTPTFCRFPACFPRWLNRMFILLCAFTVAFPFAAAFGTLWMLGVCCVVTVRCGDCDIDDMNPCDMC